MPDVADRTSETAPLSVDLSDYLNLHGWQAKALLWLLLFVAIALILRSMYRRVRRRRAGPIHDKLRRYAGEQDAAELIAKRRAEAARIVATSSTEAIAGYEIVEQIEAVFVDGFRRPEEALEGLKAVAGMKGANALTHVRHERNAAGKCTAQGDAVIVRRRGPATMDRGAEPRGPSS